MRRRARRAGFTLLELTLSIIAVSAVSAAVVPLLVSATDAYAASRQARDAVNDAYFAIDAVSRLIREAPAGTTTRLQVHAADEYALLFAPDQGVRLSGSTLELLTPDGEAPLARNVESFTIEYLDNDGLTPAADPAEAHTLRIRLTVSGMTLSAVVFPRVNIGETAP